MDAQESSGFLKPWDLWVHAFGRADRRGSVSSLKISSKKEEAGVILNITLRKHSHPYGAHHLGPPAGDGNRFNQRKVSTILHHHMANYTSPPCLSYFLSVPVSNNSGKWLTWWSGGSLWAVASSFPPHMPTLHWGLRRALEQRGDQSFQLNQTNSVTAYNWKYMKSKLSFKKQRDKPA